MKNPQQMEILHLKKSFYYFVKQSWDEVQTDEYIDGRYIKLLCDHFQAVYEGRIKDVIINIPPRMLKTDLSGVFFPAWVWARNPKKKFIFASYSQSLSVDASKKCRKLLESDWYTEKFPDVVLNTTKEDYLTTTKGGHRISIGVDGTGTGRGSDYFIADDLLKCTTRFLA